MTIAREQLLAAGFSVLPTPSQRFFGNAIIAADKLRFTGLNRDGNTRSRDRRAVPREWTSPRQAASDLPACDPPRVSGHDPCRTCYLGGGVELWRRGASR